MTTTAPSKTSAQTLGFAVATQTDPVWSVQAQALMPNGVLHWLTLPDGIDVRVGVFRPAGTPKASLVLMTGYSEFIEKYFDTIQDFVDEGYLVVLPEWRGHGKSGARLAKAPMRLHVKDFDQYRSDLLYVLDWIASLDMPQPIFGLAHSMGGQIALRAAHRRSELFQALALSAPMMDVHVSGFDIALLKTLAPVYIALGQGHAAPPGAKKGRAGNTRDVNEVTRNAERFTINEDIVQADFDINVEGRSVEWTLRAIQAMEETRQPDFLRAITLPVFIGVAEEDLLVRSQATLDAVEHLGQGAAKLYAPAMHELLMEMPDIRSRFISDVTAHFDAHMNRVSRQRG